MKLRSKNSAVQKSDSRARGRASRSSAKNERQGSSGSPRRPPADQIKQKRVEGEDSEAPPSSSESANRTATSTESTQVTQSTTRSASLGSSEYGSSATSLGGTQRCRAEASRGGSPRRRRQGFRSWWRAHHDNVVVAALGVFIVACVAATALDRWLSVQASVTTPAAAPAQKTVRALDAPAMAVRNASKARIMPVTATVDVASTKPSAKGWNRYHAPVSTPALGFEEETESEQTDPGGTTSEPYSEDSTTRSTRRAAVQRRRRERTQAPTTRRRALESWRRSRDAVIGDDGKLLRRKMHAGHRPPVGVKHDHFGATPHQPLQNNERCGVVRYTFCPRLRREVFYDRESSECVAVTTAAEQDAEQEVAARAARRGGRVVKDEAPLCNSSPNRFSSMESCRQSCQRSQLPAERCFDKTIFSECGREHVRSTRWFFDGLRCRTWQFPAGRCPDASAFRTRSQCMKNVRARSWGDGQEAPTWPPLRSTPVAAVQRAPPALPLLRRRGIGQWPRAVPDGVAGDARWPPLPGGAKSLRQCGRVPRGLRPEQPPHEASQAGEQCRTREATEPSTRARAIF
ncbi:hypothetical protein MTO96_006091 [Rhipicephalus appendiculatus]